MIALIVAGWFVCGIVGAAIAVKLEQAKDSEVEVREVLWALGGILYLLLVVAVCVEDATERRK